MFGALQTLSPSQRRGIVAAVSTISAVGLAISLSVPLLAFEMERRGISATLNGLNIATYGLAALLITPFVSTIARHLGVVVTMLSAIGLTALLFFGFYYAPAFWLWFPLRFLAGACVASLFVLSEYWINAIAPEKQRGLIMGLYATVLSIGFAAGPLLLLVAGTTGLLPYALGAGLMLLSALPPLWALQDAPDLTEKASASFLQFLTLAPIATGAALLFGALESGAFALLPVYGLRVGFTTQEAVFLASVMTFGNVALQVPVGLLSDRMNRRTLLLICGLVALIGSALIPFASDVKALLLAILFVWGGITGALYTVGLAHLGARFSGSDLAEANSAFIFCYAAGMLAGPAILGAAMDLWDPTGFAAALAAFSALYVVLCISRLLRSPRA